MLRRITYLPKQLHGRLLSLSGKGVYCISDASNWIFDWIGHYVTTYLREHQGVPARLIGDPLGLRNQIIHFIDRYAYFNGAFSHLHPSNQIFMTWFHGDPNDSDPAMQHLFAMLPDAAETVRKFVVSCQISKQVMIDFGIPEQKLITIPLGVDLARFSWPNLETRLKARRMLGIPEDAVCIGSFQKDGVGWADGLEPKLIKGPDIFLEVAAKLHDRYDNMFVLLTGPSRGFVKQGLAHLKIPYIHHFLTNYHDIVNYYHALDLYLVTSRCEGGPAALLESWATGVPIVSTRVGMPADLIKSDQNGMLAGIEDIETLTSHSIALIENELLRERCRQRGRDDVKSYDWPLIAGRYFRELYQPVLVDN